MKLTEVIEKLNLTVYTGFSLPETEIKSAYCGDLLSDVMGSVEADEIWITLQTHKNVAAIASLKDVSAVLLVKSLKPDADMLFHAEAEGVVVLGTSKNSFDISGALYELLHP